MPTGVYPRPTLEARLFAKVDLNGPTQPHMATPCHVWTGATIGGYGVLRVSGKTVRATRVLKERMLGRKLAPVERVLHYCDFPPCVRDDHTFIGTQGDNIRDMAAKGRHGSEKLRASGRCDVRALYATGEWTQKELAEKFGVHQTRVSQLVKSA